MPGGVTKCNAQRPWLPVCQYWNDCLIGELFRDNDIRHYRNAKAGSQAAPHDIATLTRPQTAVGQRSDTQTDVKTLPVQIVSRGGELS